MNDDTQVGVLSDKALIQQLKLVASPVLDHVLAAGLLVNNLLFANRDKFFFDPGHEFVL